MPAKFNYIVIVERRTEVREAVNVLVKLFNASFPKVRRLGAMRIDAERGETDSMNWPDMPSLNDWGEDSLLYLYGLKANGVERVNASMELRSSCTIFCVSDDVGALRKELAFIIAEEIARMFDVAIEACGLDLDVLQGDLDKRSLAELASAYRADPRCELVIGWEARTVDATPQRHS
jgi:hypothetical protein